MKRILLILLALSLMSSSQIGKSDIDTNAKIKAMFVYNFSKYIEWPPDYKEGNFVIGMIGSTTLYDELVKMAATKKANTQPFEVKQYTSAKDIGKCHMLLLTKSNADYLQDALKKMKSYHTLIITESEGLATKGSGINFVIKDNRQKFELNKANIEKYDLKVSSSLLSLAIVVP